MGDPRGDRNMDLSLREADPEVAAAIAREAVRQRDHIELIASENYAFAAVREAQGSILTNKYAEGYPGKRYYAGCEFVDEAENLARTRALQLFGEAGIVDILGVVGYYATNAMIMNVARTAVPGNQPMPLIPLPQQLAPLD